MPHVLSIKLNFEIHNLKKLKHAKIYLHLMFLSSFPFFPLSLIYRSFSVFSIIRSVASDMGEHSYPGSPSHPAQQMAVTSAYSAVDGKEHLMAPSHVQSQSLDRGYRPATSSSAPPGRQTIGRVQTSHGQAVTDPALNGPRPLQAKDFRSVILQLLLIQ